MSASSMSASEVQPRRFRPLTRRDLDQIPQLAALSDHQRLAMKAVSAVLPFRVNSYVLDELIDWDRLDSDPMFQLAFPQPGMLDADDLGHLAGLIKREAPASEQIEAIRAIQQRLNPHPAGQVALNAPRVDGTTLPGMQHKYRETVLFFPSAGQTCHAYCTYCFRWAQFVGLEDLKFANRQPEMLARYVADHPEVRSVLFTGGDPLVMKATALRRYVEPLLRPGLEHVTSIRLGTKAPAWWPHRFVTDPDADDVLRLFEEVVASGRHLALMAHFSHPRELSTPVAQEALRRIQSTGAVVRCQAPLIRHVNDDAATWRDMWQSQVRLGAVPYYMFVERDTGPRGYFEVPLARALDIFSEAYRGLSGLGRTVRGPSMSATPGKVLVDGITEIAGEKVFTLRFIQARDPEWVNRPFFAQYDPKARWLDDLKPAFGEQAFFFEAGLKALVQARTSDDACGGVNSSPRAQQLRAG